MLAQKFFPQLLFPQLVLPQLAALIVCLLSTPYVHATEGSQARALKVAMPSLHEETFLGWNGGSGRKFYLDALYDYLVYVDPTSQELIPGLATDWQVSEDGKTWTISLRKNVPFHPPGGELTAGDVIYSLERIMETDSRAGPASALRRLVDRTERLARHRLRIHLKFSDFHFARGYLSNGQQLPILSRDYVEEVGDEQANRHPVGSGPFVLEKHQAGVGITLRAKGNHWRVEPEFQKLIFQAVPDEASRVAKLMANEVDIVPIGYDSIQRTKRAGKQVLSIKHNWAPVIRMGGLVTTNDKLHNPRVPWADKRVRQALNYAIDKDTIVEAIFHKEAASAGMDFPADEWLDIPSYPYDPDKARTLLEEAGYPEGFRVSLRTFASAPGADLPLIAEVVAQYWQKIGIDVQVIPVDWASFRSAVVNGKATDSLWTHRGLYFASPLLGLQISTDASSLFATFSTTESQAKIERIQSANDPQTRDRLIRELGHYLHDQAAAIYLAFANEPFGASERIESWPRISDHLTNFDQIKLRGSP